MTTPIHDPPAAVVTEVALPDAVRALCALSRIDYWDAHLVRGAATTATPEQWLRELLERAPARLRRQLPPGWFVLGLRHGSPRSPAHVLGWPVRERTDDHVVLAAGSRVGMPAELVLLRQGDDWVFATLVEHGNPVVRQVWRAIAGAHRRVVRYLLRSAAERTT